MPPSPLKAPGSVLWEITLACNLRCRHCAASAGRRRRNELSPEEALSVCDQLAELKARAVCLMGGEPLARRDWKTIAKRLRSHRIAVGLITNGWMFDDRAADDVERVGISQVGVSLDAAKPELHDRMRGRAGSHARALSAIRRIARLPLTSRLVITSITRGNLDELEGIFDLLEQVAPGFTWILNISSCHNRVRFDESSFIDEAGFVRLADFLKAKRSARRRTLLEVTGSHDIGYFSKRWSDLYAEPFPGCQAGLSYLGIRSNGDVTGCLVLDDDFVEGNVRERSLASLWVDPDAFAYNRCFAAGLLEGECRKCDVGERCRGGCLDMAVSTTGSRYHYPFCLRRIERRRRAARKDDVP